MRYQPKPDWIKVRPPGGPTYNRIAGTLRDRGLHTVCEAALCPNIADCWKSGTATLMLMGEICTRGCRFCSVQSGKPLPLDPNEPIKVAETVELMKLSYVVLTTVDRDDLQDQGATHISETIRAIRERCPETKIEALVPDFQGNLECMRTVLSAQPEVLGHNLETVRRLTPEVRDPRSSYDQSLYVLASVKSMKEIQLTKSSLLLGLGESREEIRQAFTDLRQAGVDFLTLGQYLQPTRKHLPVIRFVPPEEFLELQSEAESFGFRYVTSGPLVRSSYRAGELFKEVS